MTPPAMASAAMPFGHAVLMPTSSGPRPNSASTISHEWPSLRAGVSDFDSQTRLPSPCSPIIEPGLAQWATMVSPVASSTTSARNRL